MLLIYFLFQKLILIILMLVLIVLSLVLIVLTPVLIVPTLISTIFIQKRGGLGFRFLSARF